MHNRTRPDMKRLHASLLGTVLALGLAAPAAAQGPAKVITPSIPGASAQVLPDFADLVEKYGGAGPEHNTPRPPAPPQAGTGPSPGHPLLLDLHSVHSAPRVRTVPP